MRLQLKRKKGKQNELTILQLLPKRHGLQNYAPDFSRVWRI